MSELSKYPSDYFQMIEVRGFMYKREVKNTDQKNS